MTTVLDRFRLDGQTAIVTGASRGIGFATARGFAEVGANVIVANRTADAGKAAATRIADETGADAIAVATDVSDEADVSRLVDETRAAFGSVDVLVNNAGIAADVPAEELSVEAFRETIEVNLTGTFLCSKHVGREMIESGGGSIINVSSISAFVANYPQCHVDYQASKGGLEAFKLQLASEWAQDGIRVNNVNPGYVRTDILSEDEGRRRTWKGMMLQEEFAKPADIAPLAIYLASDASSYVTGESIVIDGGYTVR